MRFSVVLESDNDAFADVEASVVEIARILKATAARVQYGQTEGACMDINGNMVGNFRLEV